MHQIHSSLPGYPDGLVQVMLSGIHPAGTPGRQLNLPLIVPAVHAGKVRIGNMHHVERLVQADFHRYFLDMKRAKRIDIPADPLPETGPFPGRRCLFGFSGRRMGGKAGQGTTRRCRSGYFYEFSSVHLQV